MLPARDDMAICFAHAAYRMQDRFALRDTGIRSTEVRDRAALDASIGTAACSCARAATAFTNS